MMTNKPNDKAQATPSASPDHGSQCTASEPWPGDINDLGDDLVAIIRYLLEAIEDIRQVATGEKQVANDDTEGMAWIAKRTAALKPQNDQAHRPPTSDVVRRREVESAPAEHINAALRELNIIEASMIAEQKRESMSRLRHRLELALQELEAWSLGVESDTARARD